MLVRYTNIFFVVQANNGDFVLIKLGQNPARLQSPYYFTRFSNNNHQSPSNRYAVNAHNDNDSVIFTGSGTTGALACLQHVIGSERVIAVVGEDSHHSLYTPWVRALSKGSTGGSKSPTRGQL